MIPFIYHLLSFRSHPSKEEFDYYFVKTKIPDDELSLAYRNLKEKTYGRPDDISCS
jgi:hypothetical protein